MRGPFLGSQEVRGEIKPQTLTKITDPWTGLEYMMCKSRGGFSEPEEYGDSSNPTERFSKKMPEDKEAVRNWGPHRTATRYVFEILHQHQPFRNCLGQKRVWHVGNIRCNSLPLIENICLTPPSTLNPKP